MTVPTQHAFTHISMCLLLATPVVNVRKKIRKTSMSVSLHHGLEGAACALRVCSRALHPMVQEESVLLQEEQADESGSGTGNNSVPGITVSVICAFFPRRVCSRPRLLLQQPIM